MQTEGKYHKSTIFSDANENFLLKRLMIFQHLSHLAYMPMCSGSVKVLHILLMLLKNYYIKEALKQVLHTVKHSYSEVEGTNNFYSS